MLSYFDFTVRASLLLALILPIFVIAPLCYPGYIQTHSGLIPLWNVAELRLHSDNFSWTPHLAQHFVPLQSDGLLSYYLAAHLPFPPFIAIKVIAGLSGLLGSVGLFLSLRAGLGDKGSLIAALIYTYHPYHITTVYVRGAWGEALFWGLLPLVLLCWQPFQPEKTPFKQWQSVGLVCLWCLLGFSQLGLTMWAMTISVIIDGLISRPKPALATLISAGILALIWQFMLPHDLMAAPIVDHLLYPAQLFSAQGGFGLSRVGWQDGLSLQIGLAALGLAMLNFSPSSWSAWRDQPHRFVLLGIAIILIFLQLTWSAWVWQLPTIGPALSLTLSYPWQLMGFVSLALALLAGEAIQRDPQLSELPLFASLILLIILSVYSTLEPQFISANQLASHPTALLGDNQIALLEPQFKVKINGQSAGLVTGENTIPLAVHGTLQPNDTLIIHLTWHPLQPLPQNWKLFIHLVDPQDKVIAQFDGYAQNNEGETYPTSQWVTGEFISNDYTLNLPPELPVGPYRVFIGLYNEADFARLPVPNDTNGRVILHVE